MKTMIPFNTRVIDRDGVIVHQRRIVSASVKKLWFMPWTHKIEYSTDEWYDVLIEKHPTFRIGDRVQVKKGSFSTGSIGEIKYIEPNGKLLWVLRDGASKDVHYTPEEVELVWRSPNESQTKN